jgi:transposase
MLVVKEKFKFSYKKKQWRPPSRKEERRENESMPEELEDACC